MLEITVDQLAAALHEPKHRPRPQSRIAVARKPDPFVPPILKLSRTAEDLSAPLSTEIIMVQAPAAVGKSKLAAYLSDKRNLPLLDLASVPVSTHSLIGLLQSDLSGVSEPVTAFHAGELPVVVDALDEGRLLSGEQGFAGFLETTAELILKDRTRANSPKLVLLGRKDSIDLADVGMQLASAGLKIALLDLAFFDRSAAWQMIHVYAQTLARPDAQFWNHRKPVNDLISAYFDTIEAALQLPKGALWENENGRAFAGYAPVLAAMGSIIAELDNYQDVANRLRESGTHDAWQVIQNVVHEILEREQHKLRDKLVAQVGAGMPKNAYDPKEQLSYLTAFIHKRPITSSGRVRLPPADQIRYLSMVEQYLPEHPFVRGGEMTNAVLGSAILAHAVSNDLLQNGDSQILEDVARQPFLWRFLNTDLRAGDALLDGRYLGSVLESLWSDPIAANSATTVRDKGQQEGLFIRIGADEGEVVEFNAAGPILLYALAGNVDIDVQDKLIFKGHGVRGAPSVFRIQGNATVICDHLQVLCETLKVEGSLWLEAEHVETTSRLKLSVKDGVAVGWGGDLLQRYPWNRISSTREAPYLQETDGRLQDLIGELEARLPLGPIWLNEDLTVNGEERRWRWALRRFKEDLPTLVKLLMKHNLASTHRNEVAGREGTVQIRLDVSWREIRNALDRPGGTNSRINEFIDEARSKIG